MYSVAKQLITEKDLYRQITILETLVEQPKLTAKELAKIIKASERTVFNDLQTIRQHMPHGWTIETDDHAGIYLQSAEPMPINYLWEHFMEMSIGLQLIKELLLTKELAMQDFLSRHGLSYETLNRHIKKINKQLASFKVTIDSNPRTLTLLGKEVSIRVFYHRLLVPFTMNNFFFDDYPIHQKNYTDFLSRLKRTELFIKNEETFGTCWFFINTIRIKAQTTIETFPYDQQDHLLNLYKNELTTLYQTEGVQLTESEIFFAFFCFIESWNYYNDTPVKLQTVISSSYHGIFSYCQSITKKIGAYFDVPLLESSRLSENLFLLFLKYYESSLLSDTFFSEYQEVFNVSMPFSEAIRQAVIDETKKSDKLNNLSLSSYVVDSALLLIHEALIKKKPITIRAYFNFQGEPAWKTYLFRELQDWLGTRIEMIDVNLSELTYYTPDVQDIIISNQPLAIKTDLAVFYISLVPTTYELQRLRDYADQYYLRRSGF